MVPPALADNGNEPEWHGPGVFIDRQADDGAWAEQLLFPPWSERIPHSQGTSSEEQDNHAS